jgi:hypothetical protein
MPVKKGDSLMKKIILLAFLAFLCVGIVAPAYASDWDVAGKILTGIEGLRIISGGRIDPIGGMINVVQGPNRNQYRESYVVVRQEPCRRVWVQDYRWIREWVPEHREYVRGKGEIIVAGHYVEYKVENGGHWEYVYRDDSLRQPRRYSYRDR